MGVSILKSRIIILACLLLTTGCADAPAPIDEALRPFVNRFETTLGKKIKFSMRFVDMDHKYAGMCFVYLDGNRKVEISDYWWPQMTENGQEQVVFHELGHCELGRGHIADKNNDSKPVSIMHPVAFGDSPYYEEHHSYYVGELFRNKVYEYGAFTSHEFDGDFQKE